MPAHLRSPLIAVVAALALAPSAHASTICVAAPVNVACDEAAPDVATALTAAADAQHQGDTTVAIGAGTFTGPFSYNGSGDAQGGITIQGAGAGATTLTAATGAAVLNVANGGAQRVTGLRIAMAGSGPSWGILAAGTVDHVAIGTAAGAPAQKRIAVSLSAPATGVATVADSTISLPGSSDEGIDAPFNGGLAVAGATIAAATGIVAGGASTTWSTTVDRTRVTATRTGIDLDGRGDLVLRDSLVDLGSAPTAVALSAIADGSFSGTPVTLTADRVTVVGTPGAGQTGVRVYATSAQATSFSATATLRSSLVWGVDHPYDRASDGTSTSKGTADLVTDYVADAGIAPSETHGFYGLGSVQQTHHLTITDPGFVAAGDPHLAAGSPMIDAGDPAAPPVGTRDLDGVARPQHDRVDIGAFERPDAQPVDPGDGGTTTTTTTTTTTPSDGGTTTTTTTTTGGGSGGGPQGPAAPPPPTGETAPRSTDVIALPPVSRCVSRRVVVLHLRAPKGDRLVRAVVTVGTRRTVLRGRSLTGIPVKLRGLPRGRWTVRVEVRLASGKQLTLKRRYRTCATRRSVPKRPARARRR